MVPPVRLVVLASYPPLLMGLLIDVQEETS